ncbi:MAG TPA: AraC family transcriptional regulator [Ferruginibacter sp.]|nr:AraC family transcriptional regulator [Ferruginibacter sp.]HMP20417.1 AraC family transcriptional regulator [Ferruginibacter sp.]
MIVLDINHTDNKSLLASLAAAMHIPYNGEDYVTILPPLGRGTIKILEIAEGLQVLLADACLNLPAVARRKKSDSRFYILHFDDAFITDTARFSVDGEILQKTQTRHSVARLTSNAFNNSEEISAHTPFKTVKIIFSEVWLKKYLGLDAAESGLEKYVSLKTACYDIEPLDTEYLGLMEALWKTDKSDPLQTVFLQNRVTLLLERFFTRLAEKLKKLEAPHSLDEAEVQRLIKAEQLLVQDFSVPAFTIDALAKTLNISSSRLKKNFKTLYGDSVYAYYQKMRMQYAREILLEGRHNVNETAQLVGYSSTSNFILAFKKQFNQLPGQLLQKI